MDSAVLQISSDKYKLDIDMIHTFLHHHAPWAKGISYKTVKQAIEGSLCFGAYLGTQQVGFARIVTDFATFGYLCDVFVLPEFRSKGYARALIQYISESKVLRDLRRMVLVTSDAHHVYRPFGFESLAHPERNMELHRPDVYTRR
jgi:GNAT superfamily N-acetyltransferase